MRPAVSAVLLLGAVLSIAAKAEPVARQMGKEFINAKGEYRHPQIDLTLDVPFGVQPGLYRPVDFDWRNSSLQNGRYPGRASLDEEGIVKVSLTIDANGELLDCKTTTLSDKRAFNVHACPHLLKNASFVPELTSDGKRRGGTYAATVRYEIIPRIQTSAPPRVQPADRATEPQPITKTSPELIGIRPDMVLPRDMYGIAAQLAVDREGNAIACTLTRASDDDGIDKRACDLLVEKMKYAPARISATGETIESRAYVYIPLPRAE